LSQQDSSTGAALDDSSAMPSHPPGYRLRRGRNWFFLGLLYAGYYLCRYNLGIVAPELRQEFNYNNAQYGGINTARDGGYAVGQFLNGLFTDGLGGKQAMAVGAVGTMLFNICFGLTSLSGISYMLGAFVLLRLCSASASRRSRAFPTCSEPSCCCACATGTCKRSVRRGW
jgi:sugar phosphate permease